MAERQYLYFRTASQTLRWPSPSSLPRHPAHVYYRSTI
jgi:hypothetical protein